jgi:hypothetical protein
MYFELALGTELEGHVAYRVGSEHFAAAVNERVRRFEGPAQVQASQARFKFGEAFAPLGCRHRTRRGVGSVEAQAEILRRHIERFVVETPQRRCVSVFRVSQPFGQDVADEGVFVARLPSMRGVGEFGESVPTCLDEAIDVCRKLQLHDAL